MVVRKDVYSLLLSSVLTFGFGCAGMPFQFPRESFEPQSRSSLSSRNGTQAEPDAGMRTTVTGHEKPVSGGSNSEQTPIGASGFATGAGLPPPVTTAASSAGLNDSMTKLHSLYREAAERYATVDSYIVRLTRREQLNGKDKPEEILLFKFRKEPWSVYFKWLGTEGKGREVVYVQGRYDNKIHTLLAAGDIPLMPAGKRFDVDPDNPLVVSSSRHSIRQAGIGMLIENFGKRLEEADKGGSGALSLKYLGMIQRPELARACEAVEQTIAAGAEAQLPRGGRRLWVFDPETKFPILVITHDDTGHEVEYYCYDRFEFPVRLDDDDFNPDKLWKALNHGSHDNN
jgi:Protein of unknown function (DUF1571)